MSVFRVFGDTVWAHGGGDGVAVLDEGVAEVEVPADQADGIWSVVREEGAAAPGDAVVRRQRPWRQQEAGARNLCTGVGMAAHIGFTVAVLRLKLTCMIQLQTSRHVLKLN